MCTNYSTRRQSCGLRVFEKRVKSGSRIGNNRWEGQFVASLAAMSCMSSLFPSFLHSRKPGSFGDKIRSVFKRAHTVLDADHTGKGRSSFDAHGNFDATPTPRDSCSDLLRAVCLATIGESDRSVWSVSCHQPHLRGDPRIATVQRRAVLAHRNDVSVFVEGVRWPSQRSTDSLAKAASRCPTIQLASGPQVHHVGHRLQAQSA